MGATQFALPAAVDLFRSLRNNAQPERVELVTMAATDPANAYGAVLRWPAIEEDPDNPDQTNRSLTRSVGASVVLRNGELIAYLRRNNPNLRSFFPPTNPTAAMPLAISLSSSEPSASAKCACVHPTIAAEC